MARDEQGRKIGRNFASLRATFSRSAAPVAEISPRTAPAKAPPLPTPAPSPTLAQASVASTRIPPPALKPTSAISVLDRRQSKYTLFDLFSKPKVQTARGYHETGLDKVQEKPEETKPLPARQERSQQPVERPVQKPIPQANLPLRLDPPKSAPPQLRPRQPEYWDAPPLFQSYPQAIKYGSLQSPVVSMESLSRQQNLRKQIGVFGSTASLPFVREDAEGEQTQDAKLHSRRYSTINDTPELAEKIFVLVTAGRLVQYAGDGNYDRMPERVLQLGEKSAAFVCDLIPGKHFVVQVLQHVNADGGNQVIKSKSLLSRLRMPASSRRAATSFLMVFETAEDMGDWLKALRNIIEDLGGAKRQEDGESRVTKQDVPESPPEESLSHRYRVSRAPSMISTTTSNHRPRSATSFSQPRSPRSPLPNEGMTLPPISTGTHLSPEVTPSSSPREANFPDSVHQSLVGTVNENSPLEALMEPSEFSRLDTVQEGSRHSVISVRTSQTSDTENHTVPTSKCSSSPPSPHVETFSEPQVCDRLIPLRTSYMADSSNARRMSVQAVSLSDRDLNITQVETVTRIQRPESDSMDLNMYRTPSITLENPRSRTSQLYFNALPARPFPNSDIMEPWDNSINKNHRPDSVVGFLPTISSRPLSRLDSIAKRGRPLSRMIPVRPSDPNVVLPASKSTGQVPTRRYSSMPSSASNSRQGSWSNSPETWTPSTTASGSPIDSVSSTPPTHRARTPSYGRIAALSQPSSPQVRAPLRRPTSLQIRSDPAPFLSQRRTSVSTRSITPQPVSNSYFAGSSPSNNFLPTQSTIRNDNVAIRANSVPMDSSTMAMAITTSTAVPVTTPGQVPPPPIPPMNPNRPTVRARTSIPAMMLSGNFPPPAPPPNMPLPSPPPNFPLPPLPMQAV